MFFNVLAIVLMFFRLLNVKMHVCILNELLELLDVTLLNKVLIYTDFEEYFCPTLSVSFSFLKLLRTQPENK